MKKEGIIEKLEKHGFEFNIDWAQLLALKATKHQLCIASIAVLIYCPYLLMDMLMKRKLDLLLNKYSLPLNTYNKALY